MNKYFIFITLVFSMNMLSYASQYPTNLEGTYDCGGSEVDSHEPFKCKMTMQKTNETYSLKSVCSDHTTYTGTGIYDIKRHTISIAFVNPQKAEETGVIIAEVKKNYRLKSSFTYLNKTTIEHGFCVKRVMPAMMGLSAFRSSD